MSKTVQKPEVISSITSIIVQKLQKYPQCKIGVKIAGEDIDSKNNKIYTKGTFFLYIFPIYDLNYTTKLHSHSMQYLKNGIEKQGINVIKMCRKEDRDIKRRYER